MRSAANEPRPPMVGRRGGRDGGRIRGRRGVASNVPSEMTDGVDEFPGVVMSSLNGASLSP